MRRIEINSPSPSSFPPPVSSFLALHFCSSLDIPPPSSTRSSHIVLPRPSYTPRPSSSFPSLDVLPRPYSHFCSSSPVLVPPHFSPLLLHPYHPSSSSPLLNFPRPRYISSHLYSSLLARPWLLIVPFCFSLFLLISPHPSLSLLAPPCPSSPLLVHPCPFSSPIVSPRLSSSPSVTARTPNSSSSLLVNPRPSSAFHIR